jgi:hypothetical protein
MSTLVTHHHYAADRLPVARTGEYPFTFLPYLH